MNNSYSAYSTMLSAENISVMFSDMASTASFNFASREITLPTYAYLEENEKMLLVSHEIGHVKYSKYTLDELNQFQEEFGALFNIIEDIYVEASIKREYPGLKEVFTSGYKSLYEHNFFGNIKNKNSKDFHLFDRINLFFKIGHVYNVVFSSEESAIIRKCLKLSSNDDVVNLCRELITRENELPPDAPESNETEESPNEVAPSNSSNIGAEESSEESNSNEEEPSTPSNSSNIGAEESSEESNSNEESSNEECNETEESSPNEDSSESSETEESSNEEDSSSSSNIGAEESSGEGPVNYERTEKPKYGETVQDFEDSLKKAYDDYYNETSEEYAYGSSQTHFAKRGSGTIDIFTKSNPYEDVVLDEIDTVRGIVTSIRNKSNSSFKNLLKKMNSEISEMSKFSKSGNAYFQMLKSAARARNAKYKKTGMIDSKSLYKYKMAENIFKHKQIFKDETNHGVVIFIDYSWSMRKRLNDVITQAIVTCEFCKQNDIKFEVYLFGITIKKEDDEYKPNLWNDESSNVIKIADTNNYDPAYIWVFLPTFQKFAKFYLKQYRRDIIHGRKDPTDIDLVFAGIKRLRSPGSTPLIRTALACFYAVKKLKSLMCCKTHVIIITDGDDTDVCCNMTCSTPIDQHFRSNPLLNACYYIRYNDYKFGYISINGIKYKTLEGARLKDNIISSILSYVKDMFNTEITFSFIAETYKTVIDKQNLVTMVIDPKINDKLEQDTTSSILVYKPDGKFADTLIIKRTFFNNNVQKRSSEGELSINQDVAQLYERNKIYTTFVKELAKTIA